MNKQKALDKIANLAEVVARFPDEVDCISVATDRVHVNDCRRLGMPVDQEDSGGQYPICLSVTISGIKVLSLHQAREQSRLTPV